VNYGLINVQKRREQLEARGWEVQAMTDLWAVAGLSRRRTRPMKLISQKKKRTTSYFYFPKFTQLMGAIGKQGVSVCNPIDLSV